ncbi:MAG: HD-GYP domain-containing protein [Candidatus Dormibacteria bacterium]
MTKARQSSANGQVWQRRPVLSVALRALVVGGPAAGSFLIGVALAHWLPRATGVATAVIWAAVLAAVSLLTLVLFERAARRLLPLAALLNVSLLFPDRAPARFAVARRTGSPQQLRAQLEAARAQHHDGDASRIQSIVELVLALSVHDRQSRGHSERVRVFTDLLADELKLPEEARQRLRWAALLHDIGKLEVPAALLRKPGAPTPEEWEQLHRHPADGALLVGPLLPWLGAWGDAVAQHHERWDGTGYPSQLRGTEISLGARIVAVADCYEVMTAPRPYKKAMSVAAARKELVRVAGTQLDPTIVRAFLNVSVGRLWHRIGIGAWLAQLPTIGRLAGLGSLAGSSFATATTATMLAVGGIAGSGVGPFHGSHAVPLPGSPLAVQGRATSVFDASGTPPPSASPSPSVSATPSQSPTPAATPTPTSYPSASPSPSATPQPTPGTVVSVGNATPSPTPSAWSCASCTNTSPSCTSYCGASINPVCTTYCIGTSNPVCTSYCAGPNNPACTSNCRATATATATRPPL